MKKLLSLISMGGFVVAMTVAMVAQAPKASPGIGKAAAAPSGARDGVHVHGHWTIVVRNPDGSVAARREVENSLVLDGNAALPAILAGFATPGSWAIYLASNDTVTGPCGPLASFPLVPGPPGGLYTVAGACAIVPSSGFFQGKSGCTIFAGLTCSPTLAVSLISAGTVTAASGFGTFQLTALQLQGSAMVPSTAGGTINLIGTILNLCSSATSGGLVASGFPPATALTSASTVAPAACSGQAAGGGLSGSLGSQGVIFWGFTATQLSGATGTPTAPVQVIPNQTVQVTVVISFS